jgi:arylsulfatase A-like enzyme
MSSIHLEHDHGRRRTIFRQELSGYPYVNKQQQNKENSVMKKINQWIINTLAAASCAAAASRPMNVVFILADDLGWADTTLYGHTSLYETPNLERLAARGTTFTRAYASSPLCSPTRAGILTGQTPARNGSVAPGHHLPAVRLHATVQATAPAGSKTLPVVTATRLDTALPTLGKQVRSAGHRTAHFGKWHVGHAPYSPREHGFEIDLPNWAGPGPAGNFIAPWKYPRFKHKRPGEHIEDRMAEEAVQWMRSVADEPFFVNYWQFSVHAPFDAKPELIDRYRKRIDRSDAQASPTYAAMVHSLDDAVGTLLDEVDRLGIADRTVVVFFSDNGGNMYNGIRETASDGEQYVVAPTSNQPLRGGKGTLFEGGIRVPCVVVWPGVTEPGSRSDARIQSTDLYPFFLNLLGIPLPENYVVDGVDFAPALRGGPFDRGPMFTYFPCQTGVPDWLPPSVAVHSGAWKLIRLFHQGENGAHDYRLFNLEEDIGETRNLAAAYPEKVRMLDRLIEAHLQDAEAVVPLPNPAFDPAKYRPEEVGVQRGGLRK